MKLNQKHTKKHGGIEGVLKRTRKPGTVEVGIIDAGKHADGKMTIASIAWVHEFGARINHPGGTPYMINDEGMAVFLPIGDSRATGMTKPHIIDIPERSFFRSTLVEKHKFYLGFKTKLLRKVLKGDYDIKKSLGLLGLQVSSDIKQKIVDIASPPNSAATIRRKKSANPLVDTGQMKNSITYEVI